MSRAVRNQCIVSDLVPFNFELAKANEPIVSGEYEDEFVTVSRPPPPPPRVLIVKNKSNFTSNIFLFCIDILKLGYMHA